MNLTGGDRLRYSQAEAIYRTAYSPAVMVSECAKLGITAVYLKQLHAVGVELTPRFSRQGKRYARFPWPQGGRSITVDP